MGVELVTEAGTQPFAEIFRTHAPYVWRCLRRLGVRDGDADDVLQEVFLIVHHKLGSYDGRAPLRAWIYGIAVRKASDYRSRAHIVREQATADLPEAADDRQQGLLEGREGLALLNAALLALDDDKRTAFVLYEIEGFSLAEIAEIVSAPLQTVHSRVVSARTRLGQELSHKDRLS